MDQIIDIATDGRYLSRHRGFLVVQQDGEEIGRTPLDQIAGLIVHAHGITWSNSLLADLGEMGVPVVMCGRNHAPRSVLMPVDGHHAQGARIRAQWQATAPMMKQAWKQVVVAKVKMQAAALDVAGASAAPLTQMMRRITSGDSTNIEAQAARYYWPRLMGPDFRRDTNRADENALLNYGYTILRSATCRAVVAAGLHPTVGLHHSNRSNAFALADDLMEPFRPLVDLTVWRLRAAGQTDVTPDTKQRLARLISLDLPLGDGLTPVSVALNKLATSLGQSFENRKLVLSLPDVPDRLTLAGL